MKGNGRDIELSPSKQTSNRQAAVLLVLLPDANHDHECDGKCTRCLFLVKDDHANIRTVPVATGR